MNIKRFIVVGAVLGAAVGMPTGAALAQDVQLELEVGEDGSLTLTGDGTQMQDGVDTVGDDVGEDIAPTRVDAGSAGLATDGMSGGLLALMAAGAAAISVPAMMAARRR